MSTDFHPTHRITFTGVGGDVTTFDVMLHDEGPAYSAEEWEQATNAAWTCDPESGEWLCEGQTTPGGANGSVEVEALWTVSDDCGGAWSTTVTAADAEGALDAAEAQVRSARADYAGAETVRVTVASDAGSWSREVTL